MSSGQWTDARLRQPHTFGSPYDQADGQDVKYPSGTRVRFHDAPDGKLWIKAPNGRVALVSRELVTAGPKEES
jgi:hypothetical protein